MADNRLAAAGGMAEDDVILAMWRSLVPPTAMEGESVESTMEFSIWNDGHGRMVEVGNNYAESGQLLFTEAAMAVVDMKTLSDSIEDVKPMVYWNQEEITVQGYPEEDEGTFTDEGMPAADIESLFFPTVAECSHHPPHQDALSAVEIEVNHTETKQGRDHPTRQDVPVMKIYKAPDTTNRETKNPYKPQLISFGPYHYKSPLQQEKKLEYVNEVYEMNKNIPRRAYAQAIKNEEARVRNYYDDNSISNVGSNQLVSSLMIDACAILGIFGILRLMKKELEGKMEPEPELDQPKQEETEFENEMKDFPFTSENTGIDTTLLSIGNTLNDIFVMENQIPFFVIEKVYNLAMGKLLEKARPLRNQVVDRLHLILRRYPTALLVNSKETKDFEHILHYCHTYFAPSDWLNKGTISPSSTPSDMTLNIWHGATDLHRSGVKFRGIPKGSGGRSLLDIKFNNGVLEIPTLVLNHTTSLLFKNIIAFEKTIQLSDRCPNYFRSYISFMNDLIDGSSDVILLARKNVVKNKLGKEEDVLNLFSEFMEQLEVTTMSEKEGYFERIYVDLNQFHVSLFNRCLADVEQKYLKTPSLKIGLVVGVLIFVCTLIGAVYHVKDHT